MPTEVLRGVRKVVGLANPTGHFRRRVRAVAFSTQWEPPTSIQRRCARKLGFLGPRLCDGFRVCVSAELRAFPASLLRFGVRDVAPCAEGCPKTLRRTPNPGESRDRRERGRAAARGERVQACGDLEVLHAWLDRAVDAATEDAVLDG